jgi:hypothetical protein
MSRRLGWLLLLAIVLGAGCAPSRMVRGTGAVHRFTVEGGFWAIRGDDGTTYDPVDALSLEFQQEGLRVRFEAELQPDAVSTHMTGTIVRIRKIQRL